MYIKRRRWKMKKLEFLADTYDKYTNIDYKKGDIVEFKDKRAEEVLAAKQKNGQPYAKIVEEVETATKKVKAETAVKKTTRKDK